MKSCSRRSFLEGALKGAAGLALFPYAGCTSASRSNNEVPLEGYPLVEAEGTYREIGRALGTAMKEKIHEYFAASPDFPQCVDYLHGGAEELLAMLAHTRERFPHLVEELEGMAEGLDLSFMQLFAYNCRSEISVLRESAGCSTLALSMTGVAILAHNEDGGDANVGRMYVAKVRPPSGVTFLAFVYPGLLAGNGPGFNDRGVVQTANYIQPKIVVSGVPRYFVGRSVLEAKSLREAKELVTTGRRAFPWHHNLMDLKEGRILSVETMPDRFDSQEVNLIQVHTNHLVHEAMKPREGEEG
ncbi:MAG: C45 family peptidase, partial [Planctomycetes bacterium]|nr:C45 family peptidase [Planctomycetota bacterium]